MTISISSTETPTHTHLNFSEVSFEFHGSLLGNQKNSQMAAPDGVLSGATDKDGVLDITNVLTAYFGIEW